MSVHWAHVTAATADTCGWVERLQHVDGSFVDSDDSVK